MLNQIKSKVKKGQWWDAVLFHTHHTYHNHNWFKKELDSEEDLYLMFLSHWTNYLLKQYYLPINTSIKLAANILSWQMGEFGRYLTPHQTNSFIDSIVGGTDGSRKFKPYYENGYHKFYIRCRGNSKYNRIDDYLFIKLDRNEG